MQAVVDVGVTDREIPYMQPMVDADIVIDRNSTINVSSSPTKSKSREPTVGTQHYTVSRFSAVCKVRYRAHWQSGQTTLATALLSGRLRFQQIQMTNP